MRSFHKMICFGLCLGFLLLSCGKLDEVEGFQGDPRELLAFELGDLCKPNEDGVFVNTFTVVDKPAGVGYKAEGGGCITAPLLDVWAGTRAEVSMSWRSAHETKILERNVNDVADRFPGMTYFFEAAHKQNDIITARWTIYWLHSVREGDTGAPKEVGINYQKVSGIRFIRHWKGSILLKEITPHVTEFLMVNELDAERTSDVDTRGAIEEFYNDTRVSSGALDEPIPPPGGGANGPVDGFDGDPTIPMSFAKREYCTPQKNGEYANTFALESQPLSSDGGWHVDGGGCLLYPIGDVWQVSKEKNMFKFHGVDWISIKEREDDVLGVEHFWEVTSHDVRGFSYTKWKKLWFHSISQGSLQSPEEIVINFQRSSGPSSLTYWKGSVVLKQVTPGVTEVKIVQKIVGKRKDQKHVEKHAQEIYDKLLKHLD